MKRLIESLGYARFKFVNGLVFIALGGLILAQFVHGIGFRFEALGGYLLGAALILLGAYRIKMGWPSP